MSSIDPPQQPTIPTRRWFRWHCDELSIFIYEGSFGRGEDDKPRQKPARRIFYAGKLAAHGHNHSILAMVPPYLQPSPVDDRRRIATSLTAPIMHIFRKMPLSSIVGSYERLMHVKCRHAGIFMHPRLWRGLLRSWGVMSALRGRCHSRP